jgi:hypothetical protein
MLRSIARIARSEGEDRGDPETALACLQVFALGGRTGSDNLHEAGYFAVRAAMAKSVTRALQQMAGPGAVDESVSAIVRLLAQIGPRFGVVVSRKVAAQAVPVIGALAGAAVNASLMDHYQDLASAYFTVRRPGVRPDPREHRKLMRSPHLRTALTVPTRPPWLAYGGSPGA